jgi:hypothetical protein
MVIFHMVSQFTIKSPAQLASDHNHMISSISYAQHSDGSMHNGVVISPNIDPTNLAHPIDLTSVSDEQNL